MLDGADSIADRACREGRYTNVLGAEMTYEQRRREGRYTNVLVAVITLNEQVRLHSSFTDGGESKVRGQAEIGVLTTSNII